MFLNFIYRFPLGHTISVSLVKLTPTWCFVGWLFCGGGHQFVPFYYHFLIMVGRDVQSIILHDPFLIFCGSCVIYGSNVPSHPTFYFFFFNFYYYFILERRCVLSPTYPTLIANGSFKALQPMQQSDSYTCFTDVNNKEKTLFFLFHIQDEESYLLQ